ncbi:MAG: chorismate synthase [Bacteroidales bacterium]|nr:chorismate synthase [Bacteroidales bacterium]
MSNSIGKIFSLTSFGESHGLAVGGIVDGCPSGIFLDLDFINAEIARRKPCVTSGGTSRQEPDEVQFLSGIFDGKTTGTPIAFVIENKEYQSADYEKIKGLFRPGHADYTYYNKYSNVDYRGGGRSSGRETVVRVVAGAIAKLVLRQRDIRLTSYLSQIGSVVDKQSYSFQQIQDCGNYPKNPNDEISFRMNQEILSVAKSGDSIGGVVTCLIHGVPVGLGEPIYDKLQARLAYAMFSIPAVKGFDYGMGFQSASLRGSENNDAYASENGRVYTLSNHCGGILGGISNGDTIYFRTAFKPTPTIAMPQQTVSIDGKNVEVAFKGRHDTCVAVRAGVVVEAMAAITLVDSLLLQQTNRLL